MYIMCTCITTTCIILDLEYITQLLSDGRGACFTIEPSKCPLLAFESRKINITAYSDMWGQYTDQLICKVNVHTHMYTCTFYLHTHVHCIHTCNYIYIYMYTLSLFSG